MTTDLCTLSLHDALPILLQQDAGVWADSVGREDLTGLIDPREGAAIAREEPQAHGDRRTLTWIDEAGERSEEHTSELQSHVNIVCRLLLEKKKNIKCTVY